jgi:hypothetical protein
MDAAVAAREENSGAEGPWALLDELNEVLVT